ncbi:MAG TPA: DegT/DnrJ/EryC1/StrS family aminotransferase [Polyangiaceae bacterium]|nr:DegT/DnrJ/EryC1/StrS family aminotransferase [Polyangiaceae bacterium]
MSSDLVPPDPAPLAASYVHPTAAVDPEVQLGPGCKVWHFCHVSSGAVLGAGCSLGQNVYVGPGVRVGAGVKVQNNVSIYSGVTLEDDVFIGPSVVFTNVKYPRAFVDQRRMFKETRVQRGATIGANATINCGVTLGEYCLVGAGAVVTSDVPAFALVVGNPGRVVGRVDETGTPQEDAPLPDATVKMLDLVRENAPIAEELKCAADRVLLSGSYVLGRAVEDFESACASYFGVEHAVGVSSGSDALVMALSCAGVGPGDEVITSSFSFISGVEAILRLGAVPRFVDVALDNYHLRVDEILSRVTARTKAVVPVHLFGQAVDLSPVRSKLEALGIAVVEDAAQAFGAQGDAGPVGRAGTFACFSFFPSKNLGGFGDGGLVTTGDPERAARLRQLRQHGAPRKYHHVQLGGNFRLDAMQAALLAVKLPRLPELLAARRAHAETYLAQLGEWDWEPDELLLPQPGALGHTYNQFVIATNQRDPLQQYLRDQGVETAIYYPEPLHVQPVLGAHALARGSLPESELASQRVLALPVHPALARSEVERGIQAILRFFGRSSTAGRGCDS